MVLVGVDSAMVCRCMDIGTAKPVPAALVHRPSVPVCGASMSVEVFAPTQSSIFDGGFGEGGHVSSQYSTGFNRKVSRSMPSPSARSFARGSKRFGKSRRERFHFSLQWRLDCRRRGQQSPPRGCARASSRLGTLPPTRRWPDVPQSPTPPSVPKKRDSGVSA